MCSNAILQCRERNAKSASPPWSCHKALVLSGQGPMLLGTAKPGGLCSCKRSLALLFPFLLAKLLLCTASVRGKKIVLCPQETQAQGIGFRFFLQGREAGSAVVWWDRYLHSPICLFAGRLVAHVHPVAISESKLQPKIKWKSLWRFCYETPREFPIMPLSPSHHNGQVSQSTPWMLWMTVEPHGPFPSAEANEVYSENFRGYARRTTTDYPSQERP